MNKKPPVGLYFHVPFCLSKCPYCDFFSVKMEGAAADAYTDAVCRAIEKSPHAGRQADTVYFGGGTPVLLGAERLARILDAAAKHFGFISPEITVEANPAAAMADMLSDLRAAGFNRVSFGVQSANDAELAALGRRHDSAQARQAILDAARAGFQNISADLMLGIPLQTMESTQRSIDFLAALPLSHISAYMLKVEEGTPFASGGVLALGPGEDALADMYLSCAALLAERGFLQYEISNFAPRGMESRHNLKYWRCEEYLGFGPSAHSFIDGERFFFPRDLRKFIEAESPWTLAVPDGAGGGFEEYAMLRLRLCEGLDLKQAASLFRLDTSCIAEKARALERNRLLTFRGDVISLTPQGFLLSNAVTADLLFACEKETRAV